MTVTIVLYNCQSYEYVTAAGCCCMQVIYVQMPYILTVLAGVSTLVLEVSFIK